MGKDFFVRYLQRRRAHAKPPPTPVWTAVDAEERFLEGALRAALALEATALERLEDYAQRAQVADRLHSAACSPSRVESPEGYASGTSVWPEQHLRLPLSRETLLALQQREREEANMEHAKVRAGPTRAGS